MGTNWNGMHRIQVVKMKDNKFVTIDWGDINQIKNCIEQYCGYEFSSLVNCILGDFIIRLEYCGYYLENIGYRSIDVNERYWTPMVPDEVLDTYKILAEKARVRLEELEEKKNEN